MVPPRRCVCQHRRRLRLVAPLEGCEVFPRRKRDRVEMALDRRVRRDKVPAPPSAPSTLRAQKDSHQASCNIDGLDVPIYLPLARREEDWILGVGRREKGDMVEALGVGGEVEVARRVGRNGCGVPSRLEVQENSRINPDDRLALRKSSASPNLVGSERTGSTHPPSIAP